MTDLATDPRRFDTIFAINVNLFWVQPAGKQWSIVASLLRPGGRLYLLYETPASTKTDQVVHIVEAALRRHGFTTSSTSGRSRDVSKHGSAPVDLEAGEPWPSVDLAQPCCQTAKWGQTWRDVPDSGGSNDADSQPA